MEERTGRFRISGPRGGWTVRYRTTPTALAVTVDSAAECLTMAWRLRLGRRPSLKWGFRWTLESGRTEAHSCTGKWDLQPSLDGPSSLGERFTGLIEIACLRRGSEPVAARVRKSHRLTRLLRLLAREAFRRTDPTARQLACAYRPEQRFDIYRMITADSTGRVGQMVAACPGLLGLIDGLQRVGAKEAEAARELLEGIVCGRPLSRLLAKASRASLSPDAMRTWAVGPGAGRLAWATPSEREAAVSARQRLSARAGSLVDLSSLFAMPPVAFALEDVPVDPVRNARWFAVMRYAGHVLFDVSELDLRERLSSFVSANAGLIGSRGRREAGAAVDLLDVDGPGIVFLLQRLLRFARATGRRPGRGSNAVKLLDECDAWFSERADESAAGRLGRLLRSIPQLDLGEVTAVHALSDQACLGDVRRVELPRGPVEDASRPGLALAQLRSPEALASEGWRMRHCVGGWVPRALAGEVAIYAGEVAGQGLTVALKRDGRGRVVVLEARRAANEHPTEAQARLLLAWVSGAPG